MPFSFGKKYKPKLFTTLYRLDLHLDGSDVHLQINQWNPFDEKLYFKAKHEISLREIQHVSKNIYSNLINQGYTWARDKTVDEICMQFQWPYIKHFEGCKKCDNFRYIPLMTSYTGCPICNKNDQKAYTFFEAEEKSRGM